MDLFCPRAGETEKKTPPGNASRLPELPGAARGGRSCHEGAGAIGDPPQTLAKLQSFGMLPGLSRPPAVSTCPSGIATSHETGSPVSRLRQKHTPGSTGGDIDVASPLINKAPGWGPESARGHWDGGRCQGCACSQGLEQVRGHRERMTRHYSTPWDPTQPRGVYLPLQKPPAVHAPAGRYHFHGS